MGPVLLAVCASVFWGVGTALQKHGMATKFPKITLGRFFRQFFPILKALATNWAWALGMFSMFGGMACFATALGKGDLTVVQPIVGLTGVVAAFLGVVFLKERMGLFEGVGIGLIILGVVLVGMGSGSATAHVPSNAALLFFNVLTLVLALGAFALRKASVTVEFTYAFAAGIVFGLANLMGKFLTQRAIIEVGEPFSLARGAIWLSVLTDYPILIVVVTNIFGGAFLHVAYANGRASVVSPIVTITSYVLPLLAALTIFGERLTTAQGAGIAVVLVGTALLARKEEKAGE